MEQLLQVGVIASTHGLKGEVKVFPTTDDVKRFKKLKQVVMKTRRDTRLLEIEGVKFFKQFAILKFRGIDDINEAEKHKGSALFVERKDALPLGEGEYYIADIIGLEVKTEEGGDLGVLKDVIETGANDVYVIDSPAHGEVLIPAIRDCVKKIDVEGGQITVHLLDGLI